MTTIGMIAVGLFALIVWAWLAWVGITLISHVWRSLRGWLRVKRDAKEAEDENS